ncbi:indole-3-glycerol phosphate synthase TrpC [Paenactinomyces guangxiensis]|uniref:Indole-3-glycerol phosphate synthase n=1 Tax=Paenactinomyces guangxiensis TaxID=1490290 RepID=A0A7W1WU42_9BACL|nr:indole-3-glycerol phosphate synthase TrpC [Paenactinomyces guangxiensis]MBA4496049.1 indole-3-glycerol phosphate synthase TrpC [Paenactinomyces guangxiensis]MBH8593137.1 indole-3-glycerol phosphate synthase TrpC [Paenactinomyces guangxiensis]
MFLEKIVATKREEIKQLHLTYTDQDWEKASALPRGCSLAQALQSQPALSVIAEVKPASPSKGVIRETVDPVATALAYERGGASAVSVLTDVSYFKGKPESLTRVKEAVKIPVLRKDFILEPVQVLESKFLGADAILLIAALLDREKLQLLRGTARQLGMEVLVEIHEESEVPLALACEADVIGINNRNLYTFVTEIETTERLRPLLPQDCPVIGESGVHSAEDAERLAKAQVDGILVGEYLMRQADPERAVRRLIEREIG